MLVEEKEINGGTQKIYRFSNGFGASVVRHQYSYGFQQGLWELAVLKWEGDKWDIEYCTPITSDVVGFLTQEEVDKLLKQIKNLSKFLIWWRKNFSLKSSWPTSKLRSLLDNIIDKFR